VVALSASAFEHERVGILDAGCDAFVTKPFKEQDLFDVLHDYLGVAYAYEEGAPAPATAEVALSRERFLGLPAQWRARFREALLNADPVESLRLVGEIEGADAMLARQIGARVRDYRWDELDELSGDGPARAS
jgi:CheY-like chemotaxis protein